MIRCRVLGVRCWYIDEAGVLREDLEKVIWQHRVCEKGQDLVLIGDFQGRKRKDVMKSITSFGIPVQEYSEIYYRWWEE